MAGDIEFLSSRPERIADLSNSAGGDRDVGDLVSRCFGVDDAPAAQDDVVSLYG
jgi:hypothetical protein